MTSPHISNLRQPFPRYELSFFVFLQGESCYKTQMHYPIPLKFGTLKGRINAHPNTKFVCNTINGYKAIGEIQGGSQEMAVMAG